jgi:hypothetical protein
VGHAAGKDAAICDRELARLDQSVPSGAREGCTSGYGVHDLTGNFDEWVFAHHERPREHGKDSALKGGAWGHVRNACRPVTTSHAPEFQYHFVSFRCCADVPAARRAGLHVRTSTLRSRCAVDSAAVSAYRCPMVRSLGRGFVPAALTLALYAAACGSQTHTDDDDSGGGGTIQAAAGSHAGAASEAGSSGKGGSGVGGTSAAGGGTSTAGSTGDDGLGGDSSAGAGGAGEPGSGGLNAPGGTGGVPASGGSSGADEGGDAGASSAELYWVATDASIEDGASYEFTGLDAGSPGPSRILFVVAQAASNDVVSVYSVRVQGVEATKLISVGEDVAPSAPSALFMVPLATGYSADISVTLSTTVVRCAVSLFTSYRLKNTAGFDDAHTLTMMEAGELSVDVQPGGAVIGALAMAGTDTTIVDWTGLNGYSIVLPEGTPTWLLAGSAMGLSGPTHSTTIQTTNSTYNFRALLASFH